MKEEFFPINTFHDYTFEEFINIKSTDLKYKALVCGYSKSVLYGLSNLDEDIGHVSSINNVDIDKSTVEIFDVDPSNYGIQNVDIYTLFKAIHVKKDGIWLISKI